MLDGVLVGERRVGARARAARPLDRPVRAAQLRGGEEVVRQLVEVGLAAELRAALQHPRDREVKLEPPPARELDVDRLAHERVREARAAGVVALVEHEVRRDRLVERVEHLRVRPPADVAHDVDAEVAAQHRRGREHLVARLRALVQPAPDDLPHAERHVGGHVGAVVQPALGVQQADELGHVERDCPPSGGGSRRASRGPGAVPAVAST